MKIAFFSSQAYDKEFFNRENQSYKYQIEYFDTHLGLHSISMASGFDAVCVFVNDRLDRQVLEGLVQQGVKWVALRCAGFNRLDVAAAKELKLRVCRVPEYSPHAVAEHAVALILALNRKTHKSYLRVREQNFSLNGLIGFDLFRKTVGVVGTGRIGSVFARLMRGFGCEVLASDVNQNPDLVGLGVKYVSRDELFQRSDVISLHCPLIPGETQHMIDREAIRKMKPGVMLINTSRGGLIDTAAVIEGLKNKHIGYLGIDVYEQEERLFFKDLTASIIDDDLLQRLVSFPNVLITGHQAFFTEEALTQISKVTLRSLRALSRNEVPSDGALLV
jgi:D-lactate dehydrogenase